MLGGCRGDGGCSRGGGSFGELNPSHRPPVGRVPLDLAQAYTSLEVSRAGAAARGRTDGTVARVCCGGVECMRETRRCGGRESAVGAGVRPPGCRTTDRRPDTPGNSLAAPHTRRQTRGQGVGLVAHPAVARAAQLAPRRQQSTPWSLSETVGEPQAEARNRTMCGCQRSGGLESSAPLVEGRMRRCAVGKIRPTRCRVTPRQRSGILKTAALLSSRCRTRERRPACSFRRGKSQPCYSEGTHTCGGGVPSSHPSLGLSVFFFLFSLLKIAVWKIQRDGGATSALA